MSAPRSGPPSWALSSWVKWSWLLVVAFVAAQSLSYHWRILPTTSSGYFARGLADFLAGDYESAVDNFTRVIERNPNEVDPYLYRSESHALQREFEKAFLDIDRALKLQPDLDWAHATDADVKALAWDTEGSRAAYSRALKLDPDYTRCYLKRGLASYDARQWGDAAADFREAAQRSVSDDHVTAQLFLWSARARAGEAFGATGELLDLMRVGRIRGDRFWAAAQFLTGQISEQAYLTAVGNGKTDDIDELQAEAFFLAGNRRLAFGDRAAGLTLLRNTLATEADSSDAYDRARVEVESLLVGFHPRWTSKSKEGLEIASVTPGGPAEAAGLSPSLILTAIDGAAVDQEFFVEFLASAEPGSTVQLRLKDGAGTDVVLPLTLTPGSSGPTR